MKGLSIAETAKRFGLSRSTLLYYDDIGLLSPKARTAANYRVYGPAELARMEEIVRLRKTGLAIAEIKALLSRGASRTEVSLRARLDRINAEMSALRDQQRFIIGLLGDERAGTDARVMSKDRWVAYLRAAGLDDVGMMRWHAAFEASSPEAHQDFLESLAISAKEIADIRERSRSGFFPPERPRAVV